MKTQSRKALVRPQLWTRRTTLYSSKKFQELNASHLQFNKFVLFWEKEIRKILYIYILGSVNSTNLVNFWKHLPIFNINFFIFWNPGFWFLKYRLNKIKINQINFYKTAGSFSNLLWKPLVLWGICNKGCADAPMKVVAFYIGVCCTAKVSL